MRASVLIAFCCLGLGQAAIILDLGPRCLALWGHRASVLTWVVAAVAGVSVVLWTPWIGSLAGGAFAVAFRPRLWVQAAAALAYFLFFLAAPLPGIVKSPPTVDLASRRTASFAAHDGPPPRYRSARNQNLEVCRYRLNVDSARADRSSLSFGILADVHAYYSGDLPFVGWCVERVNEFGADVVVILGDLTKRRKMVGPTVEIVSRLRADLGVYLVLGNHDLALGPEYARAALRDRPVRLFRPADGETDLVEGITLASSEWPFGPVSASPLSARAPDDDRFRVLLAHSPDNFARAARAGFDLVLSGHTHGGFPRVPGIGPLIVPLRLGRGLADGWFRRGRTHLFVTRGIGYVPLSPFQRNPQIACVELRFQASRSASA